MLSEKESRSGRAAALLSVAACSSDTDFFAAAAADAGDSIHPKPVSKKRGSSTAFEREINFIYTDDIESISTGTKYESVLFFGKMHKLYGSPKLSESTGETAFMYQCRDDNCNREKPTQV